MSSPILFAAVLQYIFGPLIMLTSVFLVLVVLVQKGRGGGLTGALGGAGGQSAFGAKAGDLFTRITVVVAIFWILLCIAATKSLQDQGTSKMVSGGTGTSAPAANLPSGLPGGDLLPGGAEAGASGQPELIAPSDKSEEPASDAAPSSLEPPANSTPPAASDAETSAAPAASETSDQ